MIFGTDFSHRSERGEMMDDSALEGDRLAASLDELTRVNRVLRGFDASLAGVQSLVTPTRRSLSILDVGTGSGDFFAPLLQWARSRRLTIKALGIDNSPTAIECARRRCADLPDVRLQCRDLFDIAGGQTHDIVHAALMLHHLSGDRAVAGLRRMYELSRLGVVINDLHRHRLAYLASKIVLPILSDDPMIRHDGPLSVLRAFRRDELIKLVRRANLPSPEIRWRPFFRWQMVIFRRSP